MHCNVFSDGRCVFSGWLPSAPRKGDYLALSEGSQSALVDGVTWTLENRAVIVRISGGLMESDWPTVPTISDEEAAEALELGR